MSGVDERVERLSAWANDFIIGRYYVPHYANPGELKADIRAVLAAVTGLEQRAEEARPIETLDESALRTIQAQAARVAALETVVAGLEQRADDAEERANAYARVIATESDRADAAVLAASASPQGASGG